MKIAASIVGLEAILRPPTVPTTDAATVALLIERRSYLRDNDALQNTVALLDAAASGDTLTQRAIIEGAAFAPQFRVEPAAILKAEEIAAQRSKPEVAASLQALRSAYTTLQSLIVIASKEIGGLPDPLLAAAGVTKSNGSQQLAA